MSIADFNPQSSEYQPGSDSVQPAPEPINQADLSALARETDQIKAEIGRVIVGQESIVELLLAALITNGHVLLEGVPGLAKTSLSKLLASTLQIRFNRIQFTPDLMPTDILGTTIFDLNKSAFTFKKGPIFSQIVLIDEINRAPAKTQAALMEVMEEGQVTVDGETYVLEKPFFVIATQNPVEQEGTYKLPEAQLDRFLFKLKINYPTLDQEVELLNRFKSDFYGAGLKSIQAITDGPRLLALRQLVEKVHIADELIRYIAALISATRNNADIYLGASPRASLAILKSAKAIALLRGRSFVTPDDIKLVAYEVLNHRLILSYEREIEGLDIRDIIDSLFRKVEVPR